MKSIFFLLVMLILELNLQAQKQKLIWHESINSENKLVNPTTWGLTDTLSFNMPNNSKVWVCYDGEKFSTDSIETKLKPVLKKAIKFPKNTIKVYWLSPNNIKLQANTIIGIIKDIEKNHSKNPIAFWLTAPSGLDLTAGELSPVFNLSFGMKLHPTFSIGGSAESQFFFQKKEGALSSVDNNIFLNLEFGFESIGRSVGTRAHYLQFGKLVRKQGNFYNGDAYKVAFRYALRKSDVRLVVGYMYTNSFKQNFPFLGIRLF